MAQNAKTQSTLRIVPHPDQDLITFTTVTAIYDKKTNQLVRPAGTRLFRHLVLGTPEEIAKYKIARGDAYLEDTDPASPYFGTPIFNSRDQYTTPRRLVFTRSGRVAIATDMETINLEQSLRRADKFGGSVRAHVEARIADIIMADIQRQPVNVQTVTPQPQANNLASLVQNGMPDDQVEEQIEDENVIELDNE